MTLLSLIFAAVVLVLQQDAVLGGLFRKDSILTSEDLAAMVKDIAGNDTRIVRWDASTHTVEKQNSGACDELSPIFERITDKSKDWEAKGLACEYATFCITDNPKFRAQLAEHGKDLHKTLVNHVGSDNIHLSSMASHLIYIASFSNEKNQQAFAKAGAVQALIKVIKRYEEQDVAERKKHHERQKSEKEQDKDITKFNKSMRSVQFMWSAAALQNLAASYCKTENDGRCYWDWAEDKDHLVLMNESLTVVSDGASIRQEILKDDKLVDVLIDYVCEGPVEEPLADVNPFPGGFAKVGEHDDSPNIVTWAAAGLIKNLALEPPSDREKLEEAVSCLCHLTQSPDWLEEHKAHDAVTHIRRDDPCWFEHLEPNDHAPKILCVDHIFYDEHGETCTNYGAPTEEECQTKDKKGVLAKEACCGCGGGTRESTEATPGGNDEL